MVTTIAGNDSLGFTQGQWSDASFNAPHGVAVDDAGNLYVADTYNNTVRKIAPSGLVSTLAGGSITGPIDGLGSAARFNHPKNVAVDIAGSLYVCDIDQHRIRKIVTIGGY